MSSYLAGRIKKPTTYKILTPSNGQNVKPRFVIGFDSEADTSSQGKPMLFQFSLPGASEEDTLCVEIAETRHAGLKALLTFLDTYCTSRDYQYLIYCWNLGYELTQIFHDLPNEQRKQDQLFLTPQSASGDRVYDWKIEVVNNKRQMVKFRRGKNIAVSFYDGMAFYNTSLDKAAKMLGLGSKYESDTVDRTLFTREDLNDPEFIKYAKRDAYITRRIGEYIASQHTALGIPTTISAPHLASTVFKTNYLSGVINPPSEPLEQAGLYAYHGGKNGFYLSGPHDFADIWDYDITSAYPEAMRQLPNLDRYRWRYVTTYSEGRHGLYLVSGRYNRCKWRGLQEHDGSWASAGTIQPGIWTTSYELDVMVSKNEFTIDSCVGYEMDGASGGPLARYVDDFFAIKSNTTGPERETAKLLLNSLYGKFFQKQPIGSVGTFDLDSKRWIITDPSADYDYEAGGLYHPPIAALVTGYVRARIHGLEHKYDAVMTSTDGFFGFVPPDITDLGSGLGQLKAVRGRLRIWRERMYIFDGNDGKRLCALHGFRGSIKDLESMPLASGEYWYQGKQMITLKMSNSKHNGVYYEPGTFVTLPYKITI